MFKRINGKMYFKIGPGIYQRLVCPDHGPNCGTFDGP